MGSLVVKLLSSRYTTACGTFFMIIHFCGARINLCAEERRERREARGRHPTSCAGDEPIGSVEMSHGMEIIWPFFVLIYSIDSSPEVQSTVSCSEFCALSVPRLGNSIQRLVRIITVTVCQSINRVSATPDYGNTVGHCWSEQRKWSPR